MLDIRFIRDNPELVAEKSKQKGYEVDIKKLLQLDDERKNLLTKAEIIRAQRNQLSESLKSAKPTAQQIERGKELKAQLAELEAKLKPIEDEYLKLLKAVPNMPAEDVPLGASEAENKSVKEWGEKPKFDFEPKTHWEIAESRNLIDKKRAAKVAGSRFAYIKGDLVRLQFALINFVIDTLTSEETLKKIIQASGLKDVSAKPFIPVLPPFMIRTEVFDAMDRLEPRDDRYRVGADEDELWLEGSAEHTLGPMHAGELLPLAELPIRYLGYATSFRREAGTYGKDTEGIIRMHQFDKLEMESFSSPQNGLSEHLFLIAVQEYLLQQIKIPYRVLQKCTADIGKPNARGIDLEACLPGAGKYMETHTADFMTDYQARRLGIKTNSASAPESAAGNPPTVFIHTNDATALAMGRTMATIIENYQTKDGHVGIPKVLQPYMSGQTQI
ncbi:MAG TPA: serine--tRNA ligase [Candidatus Saccharimonadales bacterium]|nr:serine--tRNA ligase [Candidatus Saccharimonadales bacterium]